MSAAIPIETFPALDAIPGIRHGFVTRIPRLDLRTDRQLALSQLATHHDAARDQLQLGTRPFITCEQVHGREIAVVDSQTPVPVPGADGLITADPAAVLGIYVADCCAVFLVEPHRRVIALLHSGRKGTEAGIVPAAIEQMRHDFGCDPADLIIQLSPCIRPPHFETDIAALIIQQSRALGVTQIFDPGTCTASELARYYSYRAELGKTGRMLALLALI